jgi:hypothetical protein
MTCYWEIFHSAQQNLTLKEKAKSSIVIFCSIPKQCQFCKWIWICLHFANPFSSQEAYGRSNVSNNTRAGSNQAGIESWEYPAYPRFIAVLVFVLCITQSIIL